MAGVDRNISLNYFAKLEEYRAELMRKLPGITEQAAAKAALKMQAKFAREESKRLKAFERNAKKSAEFYSTTMKAAFAAVSIAAIQAAVSTVTAFAQGTMDARNQINDLANAIGQSNEQLQAFGFAARLSGGDLAELEPSLKAFPKRLDDMARGTGEARAAFERLGISSEDVSRALNDGVDITGDVVERLQNMTNVTQRAAFATSIFGEKGTRLLQVLGSKGLDEWVELTRRYSDEIGPRAVDVSARWEAASGMLEGKFAQLKAQILDTALEGGRLARVAATIAGAFTLVAGAADAFAMSIDNAFERAEARSRTFAALLEGDFSRVWEEANSAATNYDEVFRRVGRSVDEARETYRLFVDDLDVYIATTERQTQAIGSTTEALKKQAEQAAKLAAAQAAAQKLVADATRKATDDQLTDVERIATGRSDTLGKIDDAAEAGLVSTTDAAQARATILGRIERDFTAHWAEQHRARAEAVAKSQATVDSIVTKAREDQLTVAEAIEAKWSDSYATIGEAATTGHLTAQQAALATQAVHERVEREMTEASLEQARQRRDTVLGHFDTVSTAAFDVAETLAEMATDRHRREVDSQRDAVDKLKTQREDLARRIEQTDDASTKARLQSQAEELRGATQTERARLRNLRQSARKAARTQKSLSILRITVDTIAASIRAFADLGPIAGGIAAAAIATTGAASAASVAATPIPTFFKGGMVAGGGDGAHLATLHTGEAVLNKRAVQQLGSGMVDAINSGLSPMEAPTIYLEGERLYRGIVNRARRAGDLREAITVAGKTGRRLVYG